METSISYPFQNVNLPLEERVRDLVSRLTLEEKISLMPTKQAAVTRLGISEYWVGGEAAHGLVARDSVTTVFPQTLGLACTWNTELMQSIGSVIGDEARACYKKRNGLNGLTLWAPTVDMARDPRWGRTEEAYGEDPHLTGSMSTAFAKGMRGSHPFYIKAVATLKHFYANNNEKDRLTSSSVIDPRNKREYYLRAFELSIREGAVHSLMTAYNSINGTPAICHPDVNGILKEEWKLDGFIVCDGEDMHQTVDEHKYCDTYAEAVALAIKGGIDCITDNAGLVMRSIREALEQGLLEEADLDRALRNVFRIRMRLGQFDPEENNPYAQIPETVIYHPEHRELALRAARESIVLLKNQNRMLPLQRENIRKLAVIGPLADVVCRDWYTGHPPYRISPLQGIVSKLSAQAVLFKDGCDLVTLQSAANRHYVGPKGYADGTLAADKPAAGSGEWFQVTDWGWGSHTLRAIANGNYMTTNDRVVSAASQEIWGWFVKEQFTFDPQDDGTVAIQTWNGRIVSADEQSLRVKDDTHIGEAEKFVKRTVVDGIAEAVKAARESDTAIVVVGNHPLINGKEEIDRPDLTLPPHQEKLIQEVYKANPNTVVVVVGSYPFALNWVQQNIPAVVYTAHGGQELGTAVADVLFGDYNPAGRLNMTWYRSADQLPDMMDYDIIKGKRTYMYFDGNPLYPFGYGLSYTSFEYRDLKISKLRMSADEKVNVRVTVENKGQRAGDEVVQLYLRANGSRVKRPFKQLQGFKRIHLRPGEKRTVEFILSGTDLAYWDVSRNRYAVETGIYTLMVGGSSADIYLESAIQVNGETVPPRNLFQITRAENYDDYSGIRLDECRDTGAGPGGSRLAGVCVTGRDGDWICYKDADLGEGPHFFEARAASSDGGSIEVRLHSPDGTVIGTCPVPAAGSKQKWQTHACTITGSSGKHTVFLKFTGDLKISWFRFIS